MGVTYQTQNRLRRKVMTAPLTAPEQTSAAPIPVIEPVKPSYRSFAWPVAAAGLVLVAAFLSMKAF
ncbi:MAG: hypothetical protein JWM80_3283 [Cyanobacteria bacterium RYN_339]|nr:hypothetical protein [Cyanobacteria bacterium RYN_339]